MSNKRTQGTELIQDAGAAVFRDPARQRVLVTEGPDSGKSCPLMEGETICIGADPAVDLALVDPTVSGRHLLLRRQADGIWVQDQDSTNGTRFQGSRVKEMLLGLGARLQLGNTAIQIVPEAQRLSPEPAEQHEFFGVLGCSRRMREIFATLENAAKTELTILIQGETGTGKEALAEAIHRASGRAHGPFVVVDCTAIAPNLIESELFGHSKGAFTGASSSRQGAFQQAQGGTVFVDEIGELPLEMQPKLLRVLERKQVKPLGSESTRELDIRLVAATNRDLKTEVEAGRFREDLYYRLAVISLEVPPLRDRLEDLPALIAFFVQRFTDGQIELDIDASALARLHGHGFPGNVRELRNAVERAVALTSRPFGLDGFLLELYRGLGLDSSSRVRKQLSFGQAKSEVVDAFERKYLSELVARHRGNVSKAAREARMDRHHLRDLLRKHGIDPKG
ncbi:MAG: sigma 54-dependent Fis family transcriptional regulator [Deltaproteobacteria bacterium]|nr:sigma 54-dependent Fis family transcriptional regulator [Deltaproteobacteria bacterium]